MKRTLNNDAEKTSYALGLDIASSVTNLPLKLEKSAFLGAIDDIFEGKEIAISQDEFKTLMQEFQRNLQAAAQEKQAEMGNQNIAIGKQFLAENSTKEGVKVTASGLQYKVISEGNGAKPTANDTVTVHYSGTLIDGAKFDSSYDRGEPATFPLNGVIKGWTEGLQLMSAGSKFRFFIPAELAYGANGAGQMIGPNSVLVFDVELISIK